MIQNFMKATVAVLSLVSAAAATAAPTILGSTLSFLRAYPDQTTQYLSSIPSTTVVAGTSDQVDWIANGLVYTTINPEADRINFFMFPPSGYSTGGSQFDGYVVSGFDYDIDTVSVLGNSSGLSIALSSGLRSLSVGLSGISFGQSGFSIGVTFVQPPPTGYVPEPTGIALSAIGLAAMVTVRRRKDRKN